ncbi:MAG: FxLYD domain-containing protein [Methanoregula sp.]|nr:FxLYD domain-containing protein [Methanoregula sp.]
MQKRIGRFLLFLCVVAILITGCTNSSSSPSSDSSQEESVSVNVSFDNNGMATVTAQNIGSVEARFDVILGCYDKNGIKIDEETASLPSLKTGETGRAEAFCTLDAISVKVTDVKATTQTETYGVCYKETSITYRT